MMTNPNRDYWAASTAASVTASLRRMSEATKDWADTWEQIAHTNGWRPVTLDLSEDHPWLDRPTREQWERARAKCESAERFWRLEQQLSLQLAEKCDKLRQEASMTKELHSSEKSWRIQLQQELERLHQVRDAWMDKAAELEKENEKLDNELKATATARDYHRRNSQECHKERQQYIDKFNALSDGLKPIITDLQCISESVHYSDTMPGHVARRALCRAKSLGLTS